MDVILLTQLVVIFMLVILIRRSNKSEQLCIQKSYGYVTDVPASRYVDANMALVHSDTIGQAPLGDPRYWLPNGSPITQGQYGLYQPETLPLSATQPFDRSSLDQAAAQMPVYSDKPLPPQCKPLD